MSISRGNWGLAGEWTSPLSYAIQHAPAPSRTRLVVPHISILHRPHASYHTSQFAIGPMPATTHPNLPSAPCQVPRISICHRPHASYHASQFAIGPMPATTHPNSPSAPCQLAWREPSFRNRKRRKHPSPPTSPPDRRQRRRSGGKTTRSRRCGTTSAGGGPYSLI
jgi:hypothetical protein